MKTRKYLASELDPRAVVVPINDFNKMVKKFKSEITEAYCSLHDIGKIDVDMRDYLIERIEDM